MLGQHLQFHAAVGGFLDLLAPHGQHVLGQKVLGRYPARHRQGGLGMSGRRPAQQMSQERARRCHRRQPWRSIDIPKSSQRYVLMEPDRAIWLAARQAHFCVVDVALGFCAAVGSADQPNPPCGLADRSDRLVDIGLAVGSRRLRPQPCFAARHDRKADGTDIDTVLQEFAAEFARLVLIADQNRRDRVVVTENAQPERLEARTQPRRIVCKPPHQTYRRASPVRSRPARRPRRPARSRW